MNLLIYFSSVLIIFSISWSLPKRWRIIAVYFWFFLTPILTFFGVLSPLTGFDAQENNLLYGLSFISVHIAYILLNKKQYLNYRTLMIMFTVFNPVYMLSGPFPVSRKKLFSYCYPKKILLKIYFLHKYLIIGVFFLFAIAPGFSNLLELKKSTNVVDIIVFCFSFECYVYFNFAGFTFISWSIMKVFGINVPLNFKEPFSAHSVIEYWQRWHISLSIIMKSLFFIPIKYAYGTWIAVTVVFIASAMWHGMTANFIIWGIFHSMAWNLSKWIHYQGLKKSQYFLLVITVLFGRLLFSESDFSFLVEKIRSIVFLSTNSHIMMYEVLSKIGKIDSLRILIGIIWVSIEIYNGFFWKKTNYYILKKPLVSVFILTITLLFFYNNVPDAIYGAR